MIAERRMSDRRSEARGGRRAGDRPGRSPQILVADSYEAARMPIVAYLRQCGFDVLVAETAEEGIATVEKCPRLVLSGLVDAQTPRFYDRLASASVPLIVLYSGADTSVPVAPAAALTKPFHLQALLNTIRKVLASSRRVGRPATRVDGRTSTGLPK
jgi:DNA-binding response OmpR family regulator